MALVDVGLEHLTRVERPVIPPGRGEVLLRMRAAALNYRDLEIATGTFGTSYALPLVPLSDGVGDVVAVGDGVVALAIGDRVAPTFWGDWLAGDSGAASPGTVLGGPKDGVLAEYLTLPADRLVRVPDHLTDEEAATLPIAAVTAWHALITNGALTAGESVLILGTGGVSIFALQFAHRLGAYTIVTSSSDEKLTRARSLGASATVNYRRVPEWGEVVRELTDGRGVDHVVEVGGPGTFEQSLHAVRTGGQIHVIGYLGGTDGAINPLGIFRRRVRVWGTSVGSRASFEAMNRAIAVAELRPVVDRVFAWTDAADAFRYLATGAHVGKVVLRF
jgi:NADPH:quinone reductase-like Zn-dependent oxidoreductase